MPKQHQARLADPSQFDHFDTNTNEGGAGVDFQYGLMADGSRTLQAIHFDAENITAEAAQAWLKRRNLTAIGFAADVGDDVQAESVSTGDDSTVGPAPVAEPEIAAFDPNQDRDDGGRFAGSKAASRKAEEASEQAAGGTGTHKDAQHAHYAAQASHLAESKRRAAEGDLGGAAKSKTMAAYHADQAETHRKESWKHEGNALGGRLSLGNPDAFTVDEHGNVRKPGAMPLGLPAPSSSDGRAAIQDAVWEFKDKIDRHNAAAASTPGVPPLPGGSFSNPQGRSSPGDVQSPRFDPKQAADANEEALNRLRRKAAENSPTSGSGLSRAKGKVRPYRPWEVAEAEQPVATVAAAILAVRNQNVRDDLAPKVGAAAPEGEFPNIHADAGVVITAGQSAPGRKPRFVIRPAYNGGPIQVSAYRLPIIVNLAGMSINAQSVAANLHHDTTKIVGHADDVQNDGKKLNLAGPISGAGAAADEFRNSHANGFPWKASIEARPLKKPELIPAGKSVEVNGRSFSGPVLVAWETELYGVAFVPRGADDKTSVDIAARAAHDTIIILASTPCRSPKRCS